MILVGYFLYSGVGISMMMHRYWTHKSFEFKHPIIEYVCTWFALMSVRGSVLGWVYVHRLHHAYSDEEKDPHSPVHRGYKVMFTSSVEQPEKIQRSIVRDLINKRQVDTDKYYMGLLLIWAIVLLLISPSVFYFFWVVPVTLTKIIWNIFIYAGHAYGYRNHETRDQSRNSTLFGLLLWGEGYHNNHHNSPKSIKLSETKYEFDTMFHVINLVKK